ncbi:MAG: hypothetical protein AB7O28_13925 [Vicinamibacterales bacterium]
MRTDTGGGQALDSPMHAPSPRMAIAILARPGIRDSLVDRVCAEVDAIWTPAGITFEWHRVTGGGDPAPRLEVTIDDHDDRPHHGREWLGRIGFDGDRPRRVIRLSLANAEALLRRTPSVKDVTPATHETYLGRALGRALSHELGHYCLGSRVHAPHGLMRAIRPSEEFFGLRRRGFELSADERAAAARCAPPHNQTAGDS